MTEELEQYRIAGFGARLGAALLDSLFLSPLAALMLYNSYEIRSYEIFVVLICITSLYKPLMEYKFGGTLGKMVVKIKIVNKDYAPITLNQAFIRWIHYFPNFIFTLVGTYSLFNLMGDTQFETITELLQWQQDNTHPNVLETYAPSLIVFFAAFVLIDKKAKRGLHDILANTYVIHKL